MKPFTITWLPKAEAHLTDLWIDSTQRQAVADAVNEIERLLAEDPARGGKPVYQDLFEIEVYPIVVVFGVSNADRLVRIVRVIELGPLDT